MGWDNVGEYNQKFHGLQQNIKSGPVESRACTDWACLIIFALIFLATFGGGGYFIYQGKEQIATMITQSQSGQSSAGFGYVMAKLAGPIVGMMVLSAALSVGLIVCTKTCPKPTMYFQIAFNFLIYIGIAIFGFVMGSLALGIIFCFTAAIIGLVLCCLWDYMAIGLRLLQCASRFIIQKPAVYFIAFMCLVLNSAFVTFWIFSWLGVYSSGIIGSSQTMQILTYVWYADLIFWGFFLYYCMTFLIASACAYWYYQSQNNSVLRGINNIKYHLGSICFGAIVITIITILRILAQSKKGSGPARIVAALAACILSCIEDLIKVLNNYSIIVMAVTGENYVDSAKSTISLIFDNLSLFIILDYFSNFYNLFTTFFVGLVPAFIGAGIIYKTYDPQTDPQLLTYAIWGGIIIFLLSIVISSIVIGMMIQALSCIYVFYCFDQKFRGMGIQVNNVPKQIAAIFDESSRNQRAMQATQAYLNE